MFSVLEPVKGLDASKNAHFATVLAIFFMLKILNVKNCAKYYCYCIKGGGGALFGILRRTAPEDLFHSFGTFQEGWGGGYRPSSQHPGGGVRILPTTLTW